MGTKEINYLSLSGLVKLANEASESLASPFASKNTDV